MKKKRIFILLGIFLFILLFFPNIFALRKGPITSSNFMEDEKIPVRQKWVSLSQISGNLQRAVLVAEDSRFYEHNGLDVEAMKDAIKVNLKKNGFKRGFSTITMQVARNLYLTRKKYLWRKMTEIWIAFKMEIILPKRRILEIYLNIAQWGKGIYGAEAASQHYFHKSAAKLSVEEASFLAAILPSPVKWGKSPPDHVRRRAKVIQRIVGGPSKSAPSAPLHFLGPELEPLPQEEEY